MNKRTDSDIKHDILEELKWNPEVKETDIGVIVKDGAVTLTGTVPVYLHKKALERCVKRIPGVRAVNDDVLVRLPEEMRGSDADIANRIAHIFEWHSGISEKIKADVNEGCVTLSGSVDWSYQRDYALHQVEALKGVKYVLNLITIRKRVAAPDVIKQIMRSLHRHATFEVERLSVSIVDGTATLNGSVDTFFEKEMIKNAVYSMPGIVHVEDKLIVAPSYNIAA